MLKKIAKKEGSARPENENLAPTLIPPKDGATVRMYRTGHGDCFLIAFAGQSEKRPVYVLIDCGYKPGSPMYIKTNIKDVTTSIREACGGHIDIAVITHEHQDHVQGVAVLARKLGVPVYFTQATHRAWMRWMMPHKRITYAAWLAQRQQDLAQKQTAVVSTAEDAPCVEDVPCAEDAPELSQEEPRTEETKTDDPCRLPGVEYFAAGT